jgi:hypothetical protein
MVVEVNPNIYWQGLGPSLSNANNLNKKIDFNVLHLFLTIKLHMFCELCCKFGLSIDANIIRCFSIGNKIEPYIAFVQFFFFFF